METEAKKIHPKADENEDASKAKKNREALMEMDGVKQPDVKRMKLNAHQGDCVNDLTFNSTYLTDAFIKKLETQWRITEAEDFKDNQTGASVFTDPFQICLLPEFLENKSDCKRLVDEMVNKVYWSRKQMDLYEFFQSMDISSLTQCEFLTKFLHILRSNVRPWLEKVTNIKLDYVSVSCSMYTCGDYLLVHDDLLKDRQVAFVYYLSPWEGMEEWNEKHGGCLEIFSSNKHLFPQFPVKRKIHPKNNQFVFFKVGTRSFHQVGEVTTFDYPRLTINGWFHGATNDESTDISRPPTKIKFEKPPPTLQVELAEFVNSSYLREQTKKNIQKRIEENSEISLYDFLKTKVFDDVLQELLNTETTLEWCQKGPANAQNYMVLNLETASNNISQFVSLFKSKQMFELLRDITDLDLAGDNATNPSCWLELQCWSHGNYTVLGDDVMCGENSLDLIYYLNATDGVGEITYLAPEEEQTNNALDANHSNGHDNESVLLTITPVDNALSIVYRCENTTRFTKYVSRNIPLSNGPVFILCCSYKE